MRLSCGAAVRNCAIEALGRTLGAETRIEEWWLEVKWDNGDAGRGEYGVGVDVSGWDLMAGSVA